MSSDALMSDQCGPYCLEKDLIMERHCMYDPFMYEGRKYLVSRAPTKSIVYGNAFRLEFGQPYRVEAPISQVIWIAVHYMREIEEIFETL